MTLRDCRNRLCDDVVSSARPDPVIPKSMQVPAPLHLNIVAAKVTVGQIFPKKSQRVQRLMDIAREMNEPGKHEDLLLCREGSHRFKVLELRQRIRRGR